jgi:hypothetical protein
MIISKLKIKIGERGQTAILSYLAFRKASPGVSGVSDGDAMLTIDRFSKRRGHSCSCRDLQVEMEMCSWSTQSRGEKMGGCVYECSTG